MYDTGQIDGLFISNGPGDPAAVEKTIATLRDLMNQPAKDVMPTFGICLGHQLLALAVGGKTYKLPFGHRGANQPIFHQAMRYGNIGRERIRRETIATALEMLRKMMA
jgi:carbamoyl-phosphate synthase small subunit